MSLPFALRPEDLGATRLPGGAYQLIPRDPCPCGAYSRWSEYHSTACRDSLDPATRPDGAA